MITTHQCLQLLARSRQCDYPRARRRMVDRLARQRFDARVLSAMASVPRHAFVPRRSCRWAYHDRVVKNGLTNVTNPSCVARMVEALALTGSERVLEIGTGSGYQTAILAQLAEHVYSVERHPDLVAQSGQRLAALQLANVSLRAGDGRLGWADEAPFDAILVSAAASEPPADLLSQLDPRDGRLAMPIGSPGRTQTISLIRCGRGGEPVHTALAQTCFMPLVRATTRNRT